MYKARIKILVKAEGQRFIDDVADEFEHILKDDVDGQCAPDPAGRVRPRRGLVRAARRRAAGDRPGSRRPMRRPAFQRWLERNTHAHKVPGHRAVTLSLKRAGQPPGDVTDLPDGHRGRPGRPLQPRRAAGLARPEPGAAVGARERPAGAVERRARRRLRHAEHRPADRHDRLPGRRFLRARQRTLDPDRRRHQRALRRHRPAGRHRRHRPAHQRLHQFLRPPSQRPHRHPRRRQGRRRVVSGHARRLRRLGARPATRCRAR